MNDKLTGSYCFTSSILGNLILWIEVEYIDKDDTPWIQWRKARVYDLRKLDLTFCKNIK